MKEKNALSITLKKVAYSILILFYSFSLNAKEKFNMADAPSPDGFKPIYTLYIFGGMFLIGIGAYFLLTKLNKDPRKKEGSYDPRLANQNLKTSGRNKSSVGAKNSRRKTGQKKTVNANH